MRRFVDAPAQSPEATSASRIAVLSCILPSDSYFVNRGAPAWFLELDAFARHGSREVVVAWGDRHVPTADCRRLGGLVIVNATSLRATTLHRLGFDHVRHYAALPSIANPRWFIPLETNSAAVGALRELVAPYRLASRLGHRLLRGAAGIGVHFYRDHVWVAQRAPTLLETQLCDLHDLPSVRFGISTGVPTLRKPTLAILDTRGHAVSFAKIATSPLGRELLIREAAALTRAQALSAQRAIAPRLLMQADIEGRFITVQSALRGDPGSTSWTASHEALLSALRSSERRPAGSSAFAVRLRDRVLTLASRWPEFGALTALIPFAGLSLPVTLTHGDFAPWNLRQQGGTIAAFDWEWSSADGLPLIDLLHHELQVGFLVRGWSVERAFQRIEAIAAERPLSLEPAAVRRLAAAAVIDYLVRLLDEERWSGTLAKRYREVLARLVPIVTSTAGTPQA